MGAKDTALMKAEQGDTDAWLALKSVPDEAARQALRLIAEHDQDLALRVLAHVAGSGTGKDGAKQGLPFRLALYAADREARTGERLGIHFYVDEKMGPIDSVVGIRDRVTKNIGPVSYEKRPLTEDEACLNELDLAGDKPDIACAYEITVQRDRQAALATWEQELKVYREQLAAIKMRADVLGMAVDPASLPDVPAIRYKPVTGIGIVLGEEMYENAYITENRQSSYGSGTYKAKVGKNPRSEWGGRKPFDFINYTWEEKAETRALRAGFRRIPGALAEYEQTGVAGEGVTFDLPGAAPVGRLRLLDAIEKEQARVDQVKVIEALPETEKALLVETMRAGAFGPEPDDAEAEPFDISADAVIGHLRADAKARDEQAPDAPLQEKHRAAAWQALKALPLTDNALIGVVRALFGQADFQTRGQASAVYHWVTDDKDAATREALAIAAANGSRIATAEEEFDGLAD